MTLYTLEIYLMYQIPHELQNWRNTPLKEAVLFFHGGLWPILKFMEAFGTMCIV